MDNEKKRRIASEVLILFGVMALLTFITRLWPILLLVMVGIIVCALRLLFIKARTVEPITPAKPAPEPPPPETELNLIQKAFGLVQRRITEQVGTQYPGARWVWGVPNAIERFSGNEPLIILLNGAGGYQKAQVIVNNLQFRGLYYNRTAEAQPDKQTAPDASRGDGIPDYENDSPDSGNSQLDETPIDYGRLAYDWVDANMCDIGARYNEAIAQKKSEMLIPLEALPHPDSWPDVCGELKRNGFSAAELCEDGIKVNISH